MTSHILDGKWKRNPKKYKREWQRRKRREPAYHLHDLESNARHMRKKKYWRDEAYAEKIKLLTEKLANRIGRFPRREWSVDDIAMLKLCYANKIANKDIAKILHRGYHAIRDKVYRLGIRKTHKWVD